MKRYKLSLTTEDGELLNTWLIVDEMAGEEADLSYPIRGMEADLIGQEINREISLNEGRNRG